MLRKIFILLALAAPLALTGCADDLMTDGDSVAPPPTTALADSPAAAKGCSYTNSNTFDSYDETNGSFRRVGDLTVGFSCAGTAVFFSGSSRYVNGADQDLGCATHAVYAKLFVNGTQVASLSQTSDNKAISASVYAELYEGGDYESGDTVTAELDHQFYPRNSSCAPNTLLDNYLETLTVTVP